jgi:hypothetical protein
MEQVGTAITGSLQFFQRAVPGNVMGGSILSNRILGCAERFRLRTKAGAVEGVEGLAKLQTEFIQAQVQAMTEQAKYLTETATKVVIDSAKTPTKGSLSS